MKRILTALAVLTLAVVTGSLVYYASFSRPPSYVNAPKLIEAAKAYGATLKGQGLPVPAAVSLKELLNRGLLIDSDVPGFAGMEVTISLSLDETHPQDVLARVSLPDGHEMIALADGSIQQARN